MKCNEDMFIIRKSTWYKLLKLQCFIRAITGLSIAKDCIHCFCERCCCLVAKSWTLWTVAHQAPLSMEFPRQEYRSGLPFPSPGDLPDTGIEPTSPALQADFFFFSPLRHQGSHSVKGLWINCSYGQWVTQPISLGR